MSRKKNRITIEEPAIPLSPGPEEVMVPETDNGNLSVSLLSKKAEVSTQSQTAETRYGVIHNAKYVNVRMEPSQTAGVLRVANEGERLIILYSDNGFYKVQFIDGSSGFIAMDFVKEIHGGETPDDFFLKTESILTSVKKLLGIEETCEEFDIDIMFNINAAIFTLRQLGIGPNSTAFMVTSKSTTYADYLEGESNLIPEIKMYLYYKTKLGFDPPSSATVTELMKQMIAEAEWRLLADADEKDFFDDGGEIQNGSNDPKT